MRWQRRGLLLAPPEHGWAATHAALPAVDTDAGDTTWLYFSPRDERGRAHVARAKLDLSGALPVVAEIDPEPVLRPGALGTFDDAGVTMSCVVTDGDRRWLHYSGWSLGRSVPFYFYGGLAVSEDGGRTFARVSEAPLLERCAVDPYLTASAAVVRDDIGGWRMFYVSCVGWDGDEDAPRHRYLIKSATSADGLAWEREGHIAIDLADDHEYALGRPCVVRDADRWRMWFCARGDAYRLAYAESADGVTWVRDDARAGLDPAADGFDSEMIAYPWILDRGPDRFLLYNGNGYGRSGIGIAQLPRTS